MKTLVWTRDGMDEVHSVDCADVQYVLLEHYKNLQAQHAEATRPRPFKLEECKINLKPHEPENCGQCRWKGKFVIKKHE